MREDTVVTFFSLGGYSLVGDQQVISDVVEELDEDTQRTEEPATLP